MNLKQLSLALVALGRADEADSAFAKAKELEAT